jgi:phenylpropionate dioxygenase-like ring-hydroxylating dioxygenase large terminal subunit
VFISQCNLEHLLTPQQYYSGSQYRAEIENLFLPGWQCVASAPDLPKNGDFLTLDLFGTPIQVRNFEGEIHAFLNVCAHRHCLLTHIARGRDPSFRCQYHGWEYSKDGSTARIPEARCFRPWDRDNSRLRKLRTERCGELIFVSLVDDSPSLIDYLGSFHSTCAAYFAPPYRQAWKWQAEYPANWKVVVENSLESYHIPCLHAKTFGTAPPEETCAHELQETHTTFTTPEPANWVREIQRWVVRRLGLTPTSIYLHHHRHPNIIFTSLDVQRMIQLVVPVSPTTTRHTVWLYTIRGHKRGLGARFLGWFMSKVIGKIARQILQEDAPIFGDVQKGLEASVHRGVIGTREERVYVFQKYIAANSNADRSTADNLLRGETACLRKPPDETNWADRRYAES